MCSSLYKTQYILQDSQVWPSWELSTWFLYLFYRSLSPYGYSGVKIMFDPTVEVSESHTLYSSFGVLAQIGGSLGLYLGVSIIDSYKVINKIVPFISDIASFLRKKFWMNCLWIFVCLMFESVLVWGGRYLTSIHTTIHFSILIGQIDLMIYFLLLKVMVLIPY